MARLPSAADLGQAPSFDANMPIGQLQVDKYESSLFSGADAIGQGVKNLGKGVEDLGKGMAAYAHQQDASEYEGAHADLMKKSLDLDTQFINDTDYDTRAQRYKDQMDQFVQERSAKISNPRLRERFIANAGESVARDNYRQSVIATKQGTDDARSKIDLEGQDSIDKAMAFPVGSPERTRAPDQYNSRINEAVANHVYTKVEGETMKRKFAKAFDMTNALNIANNSVYGDGQLDKLEATIRGATPAYQTAQKVDRSMFNDELKQKPWLADRIQTIVQGEVGADAPPWRQKLQAETIFNRAADRHQSLEQVTKEYTGPGSDGYYPGSTFQNGRIKDQVQRAAFRDGILGPVLNGSDVSTEKLGFMATGNASNNPNAGESGYVAKHGIQNGRYTKWQWLSNSQDPSQTGREVYVQEGHKGNVELTRVSDVPTAQGINATADGGVTRNDASRGPGLGSYMNPLEKEQVLQKIDQLRRAQQMDAIRADQQEEKRRAQVTSTKVMDYNSRMVNGGDQMPTAKEIANDPVFRDNGPHGEQALLQTQNLLKAKLAENAQKVTGDGPGYTAAFLRIHAAQDDPNRITDAAQIYKQVSDSPDSPLTVQGATKLRTELEGRAANPGDADKWKAWLDGKKQMIMQKGDAMPDPEGADAYAKFLRHAIDDKQAAMSKGIPINDLLDEKNPNYIGKLVDSKENNPYVRTQDQKTAAAMKFNQKPVKPPAIADFPDTAVGLGAFKLFLTPENMAKYKPQLEAIGIARGWLKTPDPNAPQVPQSQ